MNIIGRINSVEWLPNSPKLNPFKINSYNYGNSSYNLIQRQTSLYMYVQVIDNNYYQ